MSGYASEIASAATETFCVTVSTLGGDLFEVACTRDMVGNELWRKVVAESALPGSQKMPRVFIGNKVMENEVTLVEQGLKDGDALNMVFEEITERMRKDVAEKVKKHHELTPEDLHVWHSIHALSDYLVLQACDQNLSFPHALQNLEYGVNFNQSMDNVTLPAGLESLTFGRQFNQSMDNVTLPAGLQRLTFGYNFNQSVDNVTLPAGLQRLTFGFVFNQSMDTVTLPAGLLSITFGFNFKRSMDKVTLPDGCRIFLPN